MFEVVLDDARFDDGYAVIQTTTATTAVGRAGERVFEDIFTRVRDLGVDFQMLRNDLSYCAPSRAAAHTGNMRSNHGVANTDGATYYKYVRKGQLETKMFDSGTPRFFGPYEFDLALLLGKQLVAANPTDVTGLALLAQTPVAPTSQGSVVGMSSGSGAVTNTRSGYNQTTGRFDGTVGRGSSLDDLQAFTGNRMTWLSQAGVQRLGIFGKNQNGSGEFATAYFPPFNVADSTGSISYATTTRFVPPGITDYCCYTEDNQNKVDSVVCEVQNATNPGSGHGAVGANYEYIYRYPITAMSWASTNGGELTVSFTNPNTNANITSTLEVGDEVGLDESVTTAWNKGALFVTSIVSQNSSGGTVKCALTSNPGGTWTLASNPRAFLCPYKMHTEKVMARKIIAALQTVGDTDSFFFQFGSRMPHGTFSVTPDNGDFLQTPKRYELDGYVQPAILQNQFACWNGTNLSTGLNFSPAVQASDVTSGRKKNWAQRQHMLAAANDAVADVMDYLDSRFGVDGYVIFVTTDNGYQVGEQVLNGEDAGTCWSSIGGKIYVYDGSERLFCWMRHPDYAAQVATFPAFIGDLCLTVLDLFTPHFASLYAHHGHYNRDGKSLLRLLDTPTDPDINRLTWGTGIYKQSALDDGLWVYRGSDHRKLIRSNANPAVRQMFDMTPDLASPCGASDDWETVNVDDGVGGTADSLSTALNSLKVAGWDVSTRTNNMKTIRAV